MNEALVQVSHLHKSFGDFKAVSDLSFTVEAGDVYGFLGQNGAGKSTTIRMLLTLIRPDAGEINLFGMPLSTHRKEILRQVGAVIERPDLYKYLTALENLELFAAMSGVKRSRSQLMEQLEQVGLADRAHSASKTFSQGMKQRLGIAIALVHEPKLIILDEPTNGLDPQGIADMRNLILHLSRHEGKTIIVSSHLLSEIEQIANRMIIIDKGRKVAEGSVQSLLDPAKTRVSVYTPEVELTRQVIAETRWKDHIIEATLPGTIALEIHRNDIPELNACLVQAQIPVQALQSVNALEAYFLSLTGNNQHVDTFKN
jgi:ABC-type multidrug transport system ATPase subunit